MPDLSPALGATSTISIPTSSSTQTTRATLAFIARPSPGELPEPVYELWTDLPTPDAPDAATWRAVPFEQHPGAEGEYSLRLASSFQPGKQYEYTLRRLWPDGGLEWFGNGGSNGVVRVIEGTELKAEGIEVLFEDDSSSKIRAPVAQPMDDSQSDLDGTPESTSLSKQMPQRGQENSHLEYSGKDEREREPEPEPQSEAAGHPTDAFIDQPSLPPSPVSHHTTPTEPVPVMSSNAAPDPPSDEDTDSQANFFALVSAFFASLLAFLCYPLSGGRLTLGSDAGDAVSERSEHDQEGGDDHESETTDDATLKTPGDSPVASTQQTPQIKSTGLLVDIEGPSQST